MAQRMDYYKKAPEAMKIMMDFEKYAKTTGFDQKLIELIKIRVSQINGCAFCLDMHKKGCTGNRGNGATDLLLKCLAGISIL